MLDDDAPASDKQTVPEEYWWQQITTTSLLNAQVIGLINDQDDVQNAIHHLEIDGRYSLVNPGHLAGLMYAVLVVPRELYRLGGGRH